MRTGKWETLNRKKRTSNYSSMDKALDLHFGDNPPESREKLNKLLKDYAFHVVNNTKENPTEKQLDYSWNFIKRNYFPQQKHVEDYYRIEQYKKSYVYRANKNIIVKGKKYKKGQFIPKQEMLDIE